MSFQLELIIGATAAALIGVGSLVVVLPKLTTEDVVEPTPVVQCDGIGEVAKCKIVIQGETTVPEGTTTEEKIENVERMAEKIKARLDALEQNLPDKKTTSPASSSR